VKRGIDVYPQHRSQRLGIVCALAAVAALLLGVLPARVAAVDGTVTVNGTVSGRLLISISDNTANFGPNIGPDGSNAGGEVTSVTSSIGNEGAYYAWSTDPEPLVTVRSNRVWNGTVRAGETTGTSPSMTIASGVLRWRTDAPASYAEAAASPAFTIAPAVWQVNHLPGTAQFVYYYLLRVDWDDDLGTFRSVVTYSAVQ
jgi:hypothetical protein